MLNWLYPHKCIVCLEILPQGTPPGFCKNCVDALKSISGRICNICGAPLDLRCQCVHDGTPVNRSIFVYDEIMHDVIHAFKYGNHPGHGKILGGIMARGLAGCYKNVDLIIPVPMYKPKERKRGYNQAYLLAREIFKYTQIALDNKTLIRIRDADPQSKLSAAERRENLLGAFKAKNLVTGKNIVLIDDVFTTGSTVRECAQILLDAKAHSVRAYTLARAIPKI